MAASRKKCPFEKNKIYYYPPGDWRIKFIETTKGGLSVAATQYVFRIVGDPEWEELRTCLPDEIHKTKTEYVKSLKSEKAK